jgi:hypothetical protein
VTRLFDRYARAIRQGRYRSVRAAARDCAQEIELRRRRGPRYAKTYQRRPARAIYDAIKPRARSVGYLQARPWDKSEDRLIDRYARKLIRGEFRSLLQAAAALVKERARLRREYPARSWLRIPRSRLSLYHRIRSRAMEIGRPRQRFPWGPAEVVILERGAQRLIRDRSLSFDSAARECLSQVNDLHHRFPTAAWARVPRSLRQVRDRIRDQAHAVGRPRNCTGWTPAESLVFERHARAFLAGRFASLAAASRSCFSELAGRRPKSAGRDRDRLTAPRARTAHAIYSRLFNRVHREGKE